MRHLAPVLAVLLLAGCQEAEHIEVQPEDILHLKIEDSDWELNQTDVYEVSADSVTVYDKELPDEIIESVPISKESGIWTEINRIDKIYTESMIDENVFDGTSLIFVFTLRNGETVQTHVSNLIIDEYAAVTRAISNAVAHSIHYHQYDSKRY